MDLEKIEMLLSKLPINMTTERIEKMLVPIMDHEKTGVLRMLMGSFLKAIEDKKNSMEGEKYGKEIELLEMEINRRLEGLENK